MVTSMSRRQTGLVGASHLAKIDGLYCVEIEMIATLVLLERVRIPNYCIINSCKCLVPNLVCKVGMGQK